jgi:hypothetical protein
MSEQVAWSCDQEWLDVYQTLLSDRSTALKRITNWNARMGDQLPVGIAATLGVLTALEQIELDYSSLTTLFCASGSIVQSIGRVCTGKFIEQNKLCCQICTNTYLCRAFIINTVKCV